MVINLDNFFTNIEAAGCLLVDTFEQDGEWIRVYFSRNNKRRVLINEAEDEITYEEAEGFIWDLELGDLKDSLIPPRQNTNPSK